MLHRLVIWLVLAAGAGALGSAAADTITVPGDHPTIAAAIAAAAEGDVIAIAAGTHTESLVLDAASDDFPATLTLQGSGPWTTVWDAGGAVPCLSVTTDAATSWNLVDLALTGAGGSVAAVNVDVTGGGAWSIDNCRLFACNVTLLRSTADVTVTGSFFVDSEGAQYVGVFMDGGTLTVTSSTFDNLDVGAHVQGGATANFSRCIFSNLDTKGLNFGGTVGWDCICEFAIGFAGNFPAGTNILEADPEFCGVVGMRDWSLQSDSPCLDVAACGLVGARGSECSHVSNESVDWGSLKAQYR